MAIQTINPFTEEVLDEYQLDSNSSLEAKLSKAAQAQSDWRLKPLKSRLELLKQFAEHFEKRKDELARMASLEMGKPIKEATSEVEKCITLFKYYSEKAPKFLEDIVIDEEDLKARMVFEPLGVVLGVMPWNFPYWQAFRFAVPTLLIGNTVLLKHASSTLGCAQLIEGLFKEAGFPEGVYTNIIIETETVERILGDSRVQGVSLTGSTRAGRSVGELAGKNLKKSVLELGGSDPYLVLADADLELAVKKCSDGRMINTGQSCVAAKRFLVHETLFDSFIDKMKHNFSQRKMGDPLSKDTELGPLARKDLKEGLETQVQKALKEGAKAHLQMKLDFEKGFFVAPEILTGVKENHSSFDEELFGPVAMVFSFKEEEEALRLANASSYGLGGAVFSRDEERARFIARKCVNSGLVMINDAVRSDVRLAFGGVKASGYGRELSSFGLHEFVNVKTLNF